MTQAEKQVCRNCGEFIRTNWIHCASGVETCQLSHLDRAEPQRVVVVEGPLPEHLPELVSCRTFPDHEQMSAEQLIVLLAKRVKALEEKYAELRKASQ